MMERTLGRIAACAAFVLLALAGTAHAQLRNVNLTFRPPGDARVVGFHVYVGAASQSYGDYRDDINFIPPVDSNGVASYALTGIEQFQNVYISLKSYDATGKESGFSNELVVAAQQQCLVNGCNDNNPCTTDTCTATGCVFDPAPRAGSTCDDGNAMTFSDMCQPSGTCAGTLGQCNADADCPAPADSCAGPQSCVNHKCVAGSSPKPDETTCSDGKTATKYDVCRSGVCRGFACGNDAQCSDGQACDGVERCVNNACVAGTPMVCSDGNVCNGTETCVGSACVPGTAMQCPTDDGPCFDAFCDPTLGCRVTMHPDGESCLTQMSGADGTCAAGVCVATPTQPPASPDPMPPTNDPNMTPTDPNNPRDPRPPVTPSQTACSGSFAAATDVHQELGQDSETTRTIVWNAPLNPMGSVLQYRQESDGFWRSLRAVPKKVNGCDATYSVTLQNLSASARYRYRVSGAATTGRDFSDGFALQPGPATPRSKFKVAFVAGNGLQQSAPSAEADAVLDSIKKGHFPLVLGGGGYALSAEAIANGAASNTQQAIDMWKDQASVVTSNSIFAPVLGDTEVASSVHQEVAADYAEYLTLTDPNAANPSYSYDFGSTHFVAVNAPTVGNIHPSTTAGAATLAWLDADLAAARAKGVRWIVIYMHADLFSSEKTDASVQTPRNAIAPMLMKYGVNLVLSGEGNSFERTRPLKGASLAPSTMLPDLQEVTTANDGVIFMRSGSGGHVAFKPWLRAAQPTWSAVRDNTHPVYLQLTLSDKQLEVTAYGLDEKGKKVLVDDLKIF
ncbi:MAG TPA: metallophosphoesterase family protein [Myxococcota bacterium]|nr:metallophosphoesterase family protein [Myxococcota bacterium]